MINGEIIHKRRRQVVNRQVIHKRRRQVINRQVIHKRRRQVVNRQVIYNRRRQVINRQVIHNRRQIANGKVIHNRRRIANGLLNDRRHWNTRLFSRMILAVCWILTSGLFLFPHLRITNPIQLNKDIKFSDTPRRRRVTLIHQFLHPLELELFLQFTLIQDPHLIIKSVNTLQHAHIQVAASNVALATTVRIRTKTSTLLQ